MPNYSQFYALQKKLIQSGHKTTKEDLVADYTEGRTTSLRELSDTEFKELIASLNKMLNTTKAANWQNTAENKMRRKIIAILGHQMKYTMIHIDQWCTNYGKFKKPLNDHSHAELVKLITQAEQYYQSHMKALCKSKN